MYLKPFTLLISASALLVTTLAPAHARPSTQAFTCPGLKQFISTNGGVVMDTKNRNVYKLLVKNRSFCQLDEVTRKISVPTRDGRCRVNICLQINPGGGGR